MLFDPIGLSLLLVSLVILFWHAGGAIVIASEQDGAVVLVKGMAGHCLKAAQGEIGVRFWDKWHSARMNNSAMNDIVPLLSTDTFSLHLTKALTDEIWSMDKAIEFVWYI